MLRCVLWPTSRAPLEFSVRPYGPPHPRGVRASGAGQSRAKEMGLTNSRRMLLYKVGAAGSVLGAVANIVERDWVGVALFAALAVSFVLAALARRA